MIAQGTTARIICAGILAALLLSCSSHASSPTSREVRIALTADAITWLPVRLAQSLGFAAQEGVDIQISDVVSLSKAMEAMLGGSADVAPGGLAQAIQVAAQGRAIRSFLVLYSRPTMALVMAPNRAPKIRGIGDLKGSRAGVSSPGSSTHQFLNFLLSTHGLLPRDVSVVSIGTGAMALAAIEQGEVDTAVLVGSDIPVFEHRHGKAVFLADTRTDAGAKEVFGTAIVPMSGLDAQPSWLQRNPETARRLVRAARSAMRWMASHSAEEVRAKIPEGARMPDAADLDAIRQAQATLSHDGRMPVDGPELIRRYLAVSDEQVRNMQIDLSTLYTNEFVDRDK